MPKYLKVVKMCVCVILSAHRLPFPTPFLGRYASKEICANDIQERFTTLQSNT